MAWPAITTTKLTPWRWFIGSALVILGVITYVITRFIDGMELWLPLLVLAAGLFLGGLFVITHGASHFPKHEPEISDPSHTVTVSGGPKAPGQHDA